MRAKKGGAWNDVPDAFPETADGDALPARAYRLFIGDLWVRFTGRVRGLLDALGCRALVRGPENRGVALPLEHRLLEKPFAVTEFDIGNARDDGDMSVWRLDQTGRRLGQVPFERDGGVVRFVAETVAADGSVSFFHKIAR